MFPFTLFFSSFYFTENLGLNLFSANMIYNLNNSNYKLNTFLFDSLQLTELIFNGRITSYLIEESTFSITNSIIS